MTLDAEARGYLVQQMSCTARECGSVGEGRADTATQDTEEREPRQKAKKGLCLLSI